jgi:hypothetical protein
MKKIQILATRPYGHCFPIVSWSIRLMEWSKQSHVVIFFPETEMIRHAHFNTFKEEKIGDFMLKNRLVNMKTLSISDEQYKKVDEYTASKLGPQDGYFSTLAGSLIPQITRTLFGLKLKNPLYKGMTCSEFVRESMRKIDEVLVFVLTNSIHKGNFSTDDAIELASDLSDKY